MQWPASNEILELLLVQSASIRQIAGCNLGPTVCVSCGTERGLYDNSLVKPPYSTVQN